MTLSSTVHYALLEDDGLTLTVEERCLRLLGTWLPRGARVVEHDGGAGASMRVVCAANAVRPAPPSSPATLRIGGVRAWLANDGDRALLVGGSGGFGEIDHLRHRARLAVSPHAGNQAAADLQPMLTIAAALLLGRSGRILLHAGAVVADDGCVWLVVGDARSGKSTTAISLAASGWGLLSDDQVVIDGSRAGALRAEGWLRPLHLDEGWSRQVPTGTRRTVAAPSVGVRTAHGSSEIAGTLHTSVAAERPTRASDMNASEAFVGLVRQSPWLLADRRVAPAMVERLSTLARLPRYAVSLGYDTFGDPPALKAALQHHLEIRAPG